MSLLLDEPTSKWNALSDGWKWLRLGDVATLINGRAFKAEELLTEGKTPVLRVGNLFSSKDWYYSDLDLDESKYCDNGDLLYAWSASFGPFIWTGDKVIYHYHIWKVLTSELIDKRYLFHVLQVETDRIKRKSHGIAMLHMTKEKMEQVLLLIPPLQEQKRIVAILDEQLLAVEKARAACEAQLDAARALPAAYLREVFGNPAASNWERKKLGDIALQVQNGIYKASEYYGHGHPFIRMYNICNDSWILTLDPLALVSISNNELETFNLQYGDLLISRVNSFELVGKCAWVDERAKGFVFENMLIRVRLSDTVSSLFVAQQMATQSVRKQIQAVAKRAIGQASINSSDVRNLEILLPPLTEQHKLAEQLSQQFIVAQAAITQLEKQLESISTLPAAILRKAFNGEL